jgi:hypothetical protein
MAGKPALFEASLIDDVQKQVKFAMCSRRSLRGLRTMIVDLGS